MTIGELIIQYRQKHHLSQRQFALASDLSNGYISMLEKGVNPNTNQPIIPTLPVLKKLADCMNTTIDEIFLAVDDLPVSLSADNPRSLPSNIIPLPTMKKIPLVGQIACGEPILAEQNIEDYIDLPSHIHADYALTCKGESMINIGIQDGDIVYIRQQEEVENGQVAAVMVGDDEATLKRIYYDDSMVQLVAENSTIPPKVFIGEAIAQIRVVGLAVAYTHVIE